MKHGVKPTRNQKKLMQKWKLDPADWLVVKDLPDRIELVHRHFERVKKIIHKENKDGF